MPTQPTPQTAQPVTAATEQVTTVTYAVEEYLTYSDRWVTAHGGLTTAEEALARRDAYDEKFTAPGDVGNFRVTETTSVTTVRIIG